MALQFASVARVLGLALLILLVGQGSLAANSDPISLEGRHAFTAAEDSPAFINPEYDDTDWLRIDVLDHWNAANVPANADVGTYRILFNVPADWEVENPAIRLGIINRADEVFLNGVRIGGEGSVGPLGSLWHAIPPILPRLYAFDKNLLNIGRDNLLVVRIGRFPFIDEGGFFSGPVALVNYTDALPQVSEQIRLFSGINLFVLGIQSLILMVALITFLAGMRDRVLTSFLLLYGIYFVNSLRDQQFLYNLGASSQWFTLISVKLAALIWIPLIEFGAALFNRPVGKIGRSLQIITLLGFFSFPMGAGHPMTLWYIWSPLLWIIVMVPGLLLLTYWAASAVWHRQPNGVPLLIGLGLMGGFLTLDILFGFNNSIEKIGQQIGAIGFILFLFSLAVAVGLRIFETEKALLEANAYALRAHERERARLARDIHDGIGHWLSTIKLNLQMLRDGVVTGKPSSDANIDEVIGDVSKAIEDTRRIAHDLSPVLLENQGLVGAMRSHADRVAKGQGVKITVSGPQNLDLPDQVRDNLYRIYQEAVSNAVNHSQGTEINAALTNEGGVLTLTVDDNGIEQAHRPEPSGTTSGMGIRSMSERANLLGGKFVLKGNSAGGTSIKVTLPIGSNLGSS